MSWPPSVALQGSELIIDLARYVYSCGSRREEGFGVGASAEPAWLFAACASPSGASAGPGAARPESLSRKGLQTKKNPRPHILWKCSRGYVCVSCLAWTWAQGPCLSWEAASPAVHLRPVLSAPLPNRRCFGEGPSRARVRRGPAVTPGVSVLMAPQSWEQEELPHSPFPAAG